MTDKKIQWLSHTALENKNRCPHCFWLSYKEKIKQPEGIVSRLANRFDKVLKEYFNVYREKNVLPPMIKGKLSGKLQKPFKEVYFYRYNEDYGFYGKLDECLVIKDGIHVPIDFKTASSDPRGKPILDAYQHQVDEYVFLMRQNKVKTTDYGYLIFFHPDLSDSVHDGFPMIMKIEKVKAHTKGVPTRIKNAIEVLEGNVPKPAEDCPFCNWFYKVKKYY